MTLPPRDMLRFLRLITSPVCRGDKRVPLPAVAVLCGLNRSTLYEVLWTGRASEDLCAVSTPLIQQYEAGKLRFRRSGPRSRDSEPLGDNRHIGLRVPCWFLLQARLKKLRPI